MVNSRNKSNCTILTVLRNLTIYVRLLKKTGLTSSLGEGVAKLASVCITTGENEKRCSHSGKQSGISSKGYTQSYQVTSNFTLRYTYPRDMKSQAHTKPCTLMSTVAPLAAAKEQSAQTATSWRADGWRVLQPHSGAHIQLLEEK